MAGFLGLIDPEISCHLVNPRPILPVSVRVFLCPKNLYGELMLNPIQTHAPVLRAAAVGKVVGHVDLTDFAEFELRLQGGDGFGQLFAIIQHKDRCALLLQSQHKATQLVGGPTCWAERQTARMQIDRATVERAGDHGISWRKLSQAGKGLALLTHQIAKRAKAARDGQHERLDRALHK